MSRVLVTGAAGFIGAHVTRQLVERGDEVVVLVRESTARDRIADLMDDGRVRVVTGDLESDGAAARVVAEAAPEAIVHLAWYAGPTDYLVSERNLGSLQATIALVRAAGAAGCQKVVGVGTCVEYAVSDRPRRESDPIDPVSLYASTKHAAWLTCRALSRAAGVELAWARLFHVHGPGESPRRLLPAVIAALREGRAFELTPGEQVRDHLHVADMASGIIALLEVGRAGAFNVCSGEPVTLREVLQTLGELVGRPELLRFGARPHREGEVMLLAGDATKLRATGWAPRYGLRDGLRAWLDDLGLEPDPSAA